VGLTQAQRAIVENARALGGGQQGVALDDGICTYLVAVIAGDLGLSNRFPELPAAFPAFFANEPLERLRLPDGRFLRLFERLVRLDPNADMYFSCLARLHKHRLKYQRILQTQPIPTIDQVGPRGLLQYGSLSPRALTALLFWRKWIYDIDNRAAQESGYLFEPIIAHAMGGAPASAAKSPVRRRDDPAKGRQVDCVRGRRAYEIKLRVTIAASGQGRWREELDFPADCRASRYTPVLVVFDPTPNPKLRELEAAFRRARGEVYIGPDAWRHLEAAARKTMATFLRRYVHEPIRALLAEAPGELPELSLRVERGRIFISIADETLTLERGGTPLDDTLPEVPPADANDEIPGS